MNQRRRSLPSGAGYLVDGTPESLLVQESSARAKFSRSGSKGALSNRSNRRSSGGNSNSSYSFNGEVEQWWLPPPGASRQRPIVVDFRCACFKLSNISTVDFTAIVKFVVVLEWHDKRFRGTSMTTNDLPYDLWGPDIILENAQNDCEVIYDSFSLLDPREGRLRRTVTFHGPVFNPMSLEGFPFDNDELELKFISICNWRSLDGNRYGNDPVKRIYTLKPMLNVPGVDFFFLGWGGKVNEFQICGWSQDVQNPDDCSKPLYFKFDLHLTRKVQYYYLKILFPLWLLVVTSVAAFALDTDDLGSRFEFLVTVLLSTIAFLYIVQESLPKMGHLTVIDQVVICSLLSIACSVLFSFIISISSNPYTLNIILAAVNQGVYLMVNIFLVGPAQWRHSKHVSKMIEKQESKQLTKSGKFLPGMLRRTSEAAFTKSYSLNRQVSMLGDHEGHGGFSGFVRNLSSGRFRRKEAEAIQEESNVDEIKENSVETKEEKQDAKQVGGKGIQEEVVEKQLMSSMKETIDDFFQEDGRRGKAKKEKSSSCGDVTPETENKTNAGLQRKIHGCTQPAQQSRTDSDEGALCTEKKLPVKRDKVEQAREKAQAALQGMQAANEEAVTDQGHEGASRGGNRPSSFSERHGLV